MTKRSSVQFSIRFGNGTSAYTPEKATAEYLEYQLEGAPPVEIAWLYLDDRDPKHPSRVMDKIQETTHRKPPLNCALPVSTLNPAAARTDSGGPIRWGSSKSRYAPNLSSGVFRDEVKAFLRTGKEAGCDSFQQDDPLWHLGADAYNGGQQDSEPYLDKYYNFLQRAIKSVYGGRKVPLTAFNKSHHGNPIPADPAYRKVARHFNVAMSEVRGPFSAKEFVEVASENKKLGLDTVTTLVSRDQQLNEKHIATVYALAGLPIVPWDVYQDQGARYYGPASIYAPLYMFVQKHADLHNGFGWVDAAGPGFNQGNKIDLMGSSNLMVTHRQKGGKPAKGGSPASPAINVLQFVRWDGHQKAGLKGFTIKIAKSALKTRKLPQRVVFQRPGRILKGQYKERPELVTKTALEGNYVIIKVPPMRLWAIGKLDFEQP